MTTIEDDNEIARLQRQAADNIVKNSVITTTITGSGLQFQMDIRDIFRWERALIKRGIHYVLVDRRNGQLVGKFTPTETITVPADYLGRLVGR